MVKTTTIYTSFEMTNLGHLKFYLGVEFLTLNKGVFMSQHNYTSRIMQQFRMVDCNLTSTPLHEGFQLGKEEQSKPIDPMFFKQVLNKLIYLTNTHWNKTYSMSIVSCYMNAPKKLHLEVAHHVLKYMKGTQNYRIFYQEWDSNTLEGFLDVDWPSDCEK